MQQQVYKHHQVARLSSCSSTRCIADASPIRYVPQQLPGLLRVLSSSVIFSLDNGCFVAVSPRQKVIFAPSLLFSTMKNHARVSPFVRDRDTTRENYNQKQVRDRETRLTCFRDLLFPPESTDSPEAGEPALTATSPSGNDLLGPLQTSSSSPARAIQGPGIREVQASIRSLREASLLVVEAVHAWQKAKRTEAHETPQSGCGDSVPIASFQDVDISESFWNKSQVLPSTAPTGGGTPRTSSREVRFPVVPLPQVASTAPELRTVEAPCDDLPVFLWFPPTSGLPPEGCENRRRAQDSTTSNPEGVGCGLGENVAAAAATTAALGHTTGGEGRATGPPSALEPNDGNSGGDGDAQIPAVAGVNYLARMASDTDFVGQPGSALVDIFPPDAKLYRNPFILGHNLDDTLKVFSSDTNFRDEGGGTSGGPREGPVVGESRSAAIRGVDMRRVGLATAIIVAEDARERAKKKTFAQAGIRQNGDVGCANERTVSGAETQMETDDEGRRLGGAPGSESRFDDGLERKSKGRSAEGGIRFEDGAGNGAVRQRAV